LIDYSFLYCLIIQDDEYAIYNLDQQKLLYIIEVSWMPFDDINQSAKILPIIRDQSTNRSVVPTNEGN
jgi:hypothetical protein